MGLRRCVFSTTPPSSPAAKLRPGWESIRAVKNLPKASRHRLSPPVFPRHAVHYYAPRLPVRDATEPRCDRPLMLAATCCRSICTWTTSADSKSVTWLGSSANEELASVEVNQIFGLLRAPTCRMRTTVTSRARSPPNMPLSNSGSDQNGRRHGHHWVRPGPDRRDRGERDGLYGRREATIAFKTVALPEGDMASPGTWASARHVPTRWRGTNEARLAGTATQTQVA